MVLYMLLKTLCALPISSIPNTRTLIFKKWKKFGFFCIENIF